jgi:ABC-type nitrate/sulfonate/bicarbonate transport system substrate-binding protein
MARRLETSVSVVASRWLTRTAFNKENPVDLLSQLVKVLERAADESKKIEDDEAADVLRDAVGSVRNVSREVQTAWRHRSKR